MWRKTTKTYVLNENYKNLQLKYAENVEILVQMYEANQFDQILWNMPKRNEFGGEITLGEKKSEKYKVWELLGLSADVIHHFLF